MDTENKDAKTLDKAEVLHERAVIAAARFLERRGCSTVERAEGGPADLIGIDEDAVHFVQVQEDPGTEAGFSGEDIGCDARDRFERQAAAWLSGRPEIVDRAVSFDIVTIMVTSPNTAFLRMHRNAFSGL